MWFWGTYCPSYAIYVLFLNYVWNLSSKIPAPAPKTCSLALADAKLSSLLLRKYYFRPFPGAASFLKRIFFLECITFQNDIVTHFCLMNLFYFFKYHFPCFQEIDFLVSLIECVTDWEKLWDQQPKLIWLTLQLSVETNTKPSTSFDLNYHRYFY